MSNGDTPITNTDAIFARAYADAIKNKFQVDIGDHFIILTSPVTQRGLAAGDLIYPQMTNYLIYKFADALQYSDNPSYTGGSAGSYIQQLRSYLDWIKTDRNVSQVVAARMARARDNATDSNTNYFNKLMAGQTQWNQVKNLYPDLTFWEWAKTHYPALAEAERIRQTATKELYAAMQLYFGPNADKLSGYMDGIVNASGPIPMPGYNQDGLVDDRDLISSAIKYANSGQKPPEQPIAQSTIRVPAYNIPSYSSQVQSWITKGGQGAPRDQIVGIDVSQGMQTTWADFGFKDVKRGGSVDFWPFFFAEVLTQNKTWERRVLDTKGRENSISLEIAMIGVGKFDIKPGEWDVPTIKTLFPNRLPAAPEVLSPKYAKIVSMLVGYDVELKVQFASGIKEQVNSIYEEVKSTGGRMSIFGFRVSNGAEGGSDDRVDTKFEDVKWDMASGSMGLTPNKGQVYPTMLAAIAQRFD